MIMMLLYVVDNDTKDEADTVRTSSSSSSSFYFSYSLIYLHFAIPGYSNPFNIYVMYLFLGISTLLRHLVFLFLFGFTTRT